MPFKIQVLLGSIPAGCGSTHMLKYIKILVVTSLSPQNNNNKNILLLLFYLQSNNNNIFFLRKRK
jgi:hypothetical protein